MKIWIALVVALLGTSLVRAQKLEFGAASEIAIQADGRRKPLDTFAAESLQTISGRRSISLAGRGERLSAVDALFSIWFQTRDWSRVPVVLVSDSVLKGELALAKTDRLHSLQLLAENPALNRFREAIIAKRSRGDELTKLEREAEIVLSRMGLLQQLMTGEALRIVPSKQGGKAEWLTASQVTAHYGAEASENVRAGLQRVLETYSSRDAGQFSSACRELRDVLARLNPTVYPAASSISREVHYNHLHPFRWAWVLYIAAFFLLLMKARGFGLAVLSAGLALNSYGFVLRCWIAGHAPVTNMYESVVWVSLGVAAFGLIFDLIHRTRFYSLTAAPLAVLGLILSDALPAVLNSKIGPLPPVLRDNFWLTTHVLTITLGYSAFALAMGLAHLILGAYLLKPAAIADKARLHQFLKRVLEIGILLLAAGTILGGVWANYSWGRFWGWDPKETWALIALLLYIFAVHGRIAGWWGNFGLSVAAVLAFNGVLMAWYGVNFVLGKGLHSYGFGGGGLPWMAGWVALDSLFVAACAIVSWRQRRQQRVEPSTLTVTTAPARAH